MKNSSTRFRRFSSIKSLCCNQQFVQWTVTLNVMNSWISASLLQKTSHALSVRMECASHCWVEVAEHLASTCNGLLNCIQIEQQYVHCFYHQILNPVQPSPSLEQGTNFKHRRAPAMLTGALAPMELAMKEKCNRLSQSGVPDHF